MRWNCRPCALNQTVDFISGELTASTNSAYFASLPFLNATVPAKRHRKRLAWRWLTSEQASAAWRRRCAMAALRKDACRAAALGRAPRVEGKRAALRAAFDAASPTDPNLFYVNASSFWHELWHESPTVGGCHPTDEGGELIAEFYTRMIPKWLATTTAAAAAAAAGSRD